ncbi:MAG: MCE family protein, partial [Rhodobacteraceae bacterium]|nr:MCE family protein [Paracoccaceae bacterium]
METRANYILIGAVTLFGIFGGLGFFLWLAKVQIDQQYAYYDVTFDSVEGLGRASAVRYNGVDVGQVLSIALDPEDPNKVRVRIEVDAETPVKTDTTATLSSQGVTGVSFVSLSGGTPEAALLAEESPLAVPIIPSERSVVQELIADAPDLLSEALVLLRGLTEFTGPENRDAVAGILRNVENASGRLDAALTDFSDISQTVAAATEQITLFTGRLDTIGANTDAVLVTADDTLRNASAAMAEAERTLRGATDALASAQKAFDTADAVIVERAPGVLDRVEAAAGSVEAVLDTLGMQAGSAIARIEDAADIAVARLEQSEATIALADDALIETSAAMGAVEQTATAFDSLLAGEGAALIADTRSAMARLDTLLSEAIPPILADIGTASNTANTVIAEVGADVTAFSGRLDALGAETETALSDASETFRTATATLADISAALDTAERTLVTAEGTLTRTNRILDEDVAAIAADIRGTTGRLDATIAQVSADLPEIMASLRTVASNAAEVSADLP